MADQKPEIICYNSGKHNEDITKTNSRLVKGASWKKQRIILLIPSANLMPAKVTLSWMNLIWPPNQQVFRMLLLGQEVGEAYSNAIEYILSHPELSTWEYILTLEHDNAPQPDGVIRLLERMEEYPQASVFSGLYFTKGPGGVAQIWGSPELDPVINYRPIPPRTDGGVMEAYGLGMGFSLFRLKMFKDKKLRRPWFKTLNGKNAEGVGTQDLHAWNDFRKHGYRGFVDCGCAVGHYDVNDDIMW